MTLPFNPSAGQVALVEPQTRGRAGLARACPLIGVVDSSADDLLIIRGVSSPNLASGTEVVVSVFAPDALYRIHASARWDTSERLTIDPIHSVDRVQRRQWPRYPIRLDVAMAALTASDGYVTGSVGRTIDLSMGGLRVETRRRLPPGRDMKVMITLPDGGRFVEGTSVVSANVSDDGCEYGLAFDHLDDFDTGRLSALVGGLASLGRGA